MRTARKFADAVGPAPGRLQAEAVRARFAQLHAHGCDIHVDRIKSLEPKLFEDLWLTTHPRNVVLAGTGRWVALFVVTASPPHAVTSLVITDEGEALEKQLLLLDAEVFWPAEAPEPLVAVSSTHPWMSSCWRHMRFRIFRAGKHAHHPITVLARDPLGGRWCSGADVTVAGDELAVRYMDWKGPVSPAAVERPYVVSFRFDPKSQALHETFGFAPGVEHDAGSVFAHLVEDWMKRDWSVAAQATVAPERLRRTHAELHARKIEGELTTQLHGEGENGRRLTVFCATAEGAPCAAWPVPIDFHLRRSDGRWRVNAVRIWQSRGSR